MRLLLDTQIVHMLAGRPSRLSMAERRALGDSSNSFAVSAVSLWELRVKWQLSYRSGARKGEIDPAAAIDVLDRLAFSYERLPLTFDHCIASLDHPLSHSDPFDRLLLTQAQVESMRLLTRDSLLEHHPLALYA